MGQTFDSIDLLSAEHLIENANKQAPSSHVTSSISSRNSNMQQSNLSQVSFLGREPESPATLTNLTITNSINSDVSLVKDPEFWRRFSVAIHRDEEQAQQPERKKTER